MFRISPRFAVFLCGFALLSSHCVAAPAAVHNYRYADFEDFVSGDPAMPRATRGSSNWRCMRSLRPLPSTPEPKACRRRKTARSTW